MKTRKDSDVTDLIDLVYIENDNELLRPIWLGVNQDNDVTNYIGVVDEKTELNYLGLSNRVCYVTKTR